MKSSLVGARYVAGAGIIWGLISLYVNFMKSMNIREMDIVAVRYICSAVAILIVLLIYNRSLLKVRPRDLWCFFGTGVLSLAMFNFFYFSNIIISSPGTAAVLMYTSPIFILIMARLIFKEKMSFVKIAACVLTFIGCGLVSGIGGESISAKGLIFGLFSGFGYGLYSIFGKIATDKGYSSLTITAYSFFFAAMGTLPFANFKGIGAVFTGHDIVYLPVVVICSAAITIIPYFMYTIGLAYIETGKAGVIAAIEVVVAAVVGFVAFDETFGSIKVAGIILVLASVAAMNIDFKNRLKKRNKPRRC